MTDTYESTPHSGGYYHVSTSYWPNGEKNVVSSTLPGLPAWTYTPDGEGRIASVSASTGQNPVTGTIYNVASQATSVTLGSGDADSFSYDSSTGRMTQFSFNVNGTAETGTLTWNANGTVGNLNVNDPFGSNGQNCNFGYDDEGRLSSACGTSYGYDPFGNISGYGLDGEVQHGHESAFDGTERDHANLRR